MGQQVNLQTYCIASVYVFNAYVSCIRKFEYKEHFPYGDAEECKVHLFRGL